MAIDQQLSLEVGGEIGQGIVSSFAIKGRVGVKGQLDRDDRVMVQVIDQDGEIVWSKYGSVSSVAILTKKDSAMRWTERAHSITLEDEA